MIPPRRELASGAGWRVLDIVCTAGPDNAPVEEWYDVVNIAFVLDGTFHYRSEQGGATLAPGGVVLGNYGACFQCGHEHSVGDRCIAFHYAPATFEEIVAATPGVKALAFAPASLPPLETLAPLLAAAEAARNKSATESFEELAFEAAGAVVRIAAQVENEPARTRAADERRVSESLRRIESETLVDFSLADLAREAGMSRFHFLRVFRDVAGVTPRQFILRRRLHRAAVRLRTSDDPVSAIAFDEGFEDLSTFNRRFRRVMGASPTEFRAAR